MKYIKILHGIMLPITLAMTILFFVVGMVTLNIATMSKVYLEKTLQEEIDKRKQQQINIISRNQLSNAIQEKIFFVNKNLEDSFGFRCAFVKAATVSGNASCSSREADIQFYSSSILTQQYSYPDPTDPQTTFPVTVNITQTRYNTLGISGVYDLYLEAEIGLGVNKGTKKITSNLKIIKECPQLLSITSNSIGRITDLTKLSKKTKMIPLAATQLANLNQYNSMDLPQKYPNLYCTCSKGETLADGTCFLCDDGYYLKGGTCVSCPVNGTCADNVFVCNAGTYSAVVDNVDYCLKNTTIPNCSVSAKDSNTCATCKNEYYLKDGVLELNVKPSDLTLLASNKIYFSKNASNKLLYTVVDSSSPTKQKVTGTTNINTTAADLTTNFIESIKDTIVNNVNIKKHIPNQCLSCLVNATCRNNKITCNSGFTQVPASVTNSWEITSCDYSCPATSSFFTTKPATIGKFVKAVGSGSGGCYCPAHNYWKTTAATGTIAATAACTLCPGGSEYYVNPPSGIGETAVPNNCYCLADQYWKTTVTPNACTACPGTSKYYVNLPPDIGGASVANKCYCPVNQYWKVTPDIPATGSTPAIPTTAACTACPAGTKYYAPASSSLKGGAAEDNCYCPANKYWKVTPGIPATGSTPAIPTTAACAVCPGGSDYYSPGNLSLKGGLVVDNCYCKLNFYFNTISNKCTRCNYYWDSSNNACKQCPSGSDYSANSITDRARVPNSSCYCKANNYWDTSSKACTPCPSGSTYSPVVIPGRLAIYNTGCYCALGSDWTGIGNSRYGDCKPCSNIVNNSEFNLQVSAGIGAKIGTSNCYCRRDFYLISSISPNGSPAYTCVANNAINCFQKSLTANECTNCNKGYKLDNRKTTCVACPAGYFSPNNGATSCTQCAEGKYSLGGASICSDCSGIGTSTRTCSPTTGGAVDCVAGYVLSGTSGASGVVCNSCPAGQYFVVGASNGSSCVPCPAGYFSLNNGATSCTQCAEGKYSLGGASICSDCSGIGTSTRTCSPTTGGALDCVAGYGLSGTSGASGVVCNACAAGQYSVGGAGNGSSCIPCYTGDVKSSPACTPVSNTQCADNAILSGNICSCEENAHMDSGVACVCDNGYYLNGNSCTPCYTGAIKNNPTCSQVTNTQCLDNATVTNNQCVCNQGYAYIRPIASTLFSAACVRACEPGKGIYLLGLSCIPCSDKTWSAGDTPCQTHNDIEGCLTYSKTAPGCELCDSPGGYYWKPLSDGTCTILS